MIKVEVVSPFRDKSDPTKVIPIKTKLEVSKDRYEEIKEYVKIIKDTDKNND